VGRNWALGALVFIVLLWGYRAAQHYRAEQDALQHDWNGANVLRVSANPYPITPWRWHCVVETPNAFITSIVDTRTDTVTSDSVSDSFYKSPESAAVIAAKRSHFGQIYLDWAKFAYVEELGRLPLPDGTGSMVTLVRFRDLRFDYGNDDRKFGIDPNRSPLAALVYVDDQQHVVLVQMSGEEEK